MTHSAKVTETRRLPDLPFEASCACGTGGHFAKKDEATNYLNAHFRKLNSRDVLGATIEYVEFVEPKKSAPVAVAPKPAAPVPPVAPVEETTNVTQPPADEPAKEN